MKYILSVLTVFIMITSCTSEKKTATPLEESDLHKVVVQEVMHVSEYSYIRVIEKGVEKWIAAPRTMVEIGNTYYYGKFMKMENFESEDLGKTFGTVYFVEKISENAVEATIPLTENPHPQDTTMSGEKPSIVKKEIKVATVPNGISIAALMENKEKYNNTIVTIKGEVTKYNASIMNSNWFHVQDGSEFKGEFDLTVTTSEEVKQGDIITFKGKVSLDKDFGAGYFYKIIIENATIIK
ncbi:MAG: hypothetical protein JKY08_05715 [Flavobacteriaceae bacterium]|nr:hypothetical protein [Flavobacteriaceae bacterium]